MAKKSAKRGKKPGVYCVKTKPATRGSRCLIKKVDGTVRFLKSGNIKCPKSCRKGGKK
jgi:hypothetical protein